MNRQPAVNIETHKHTIQLKNKNTYRSLNMNVNA